MSPITERQRRRDDEQRIECASRPVGRRQRRRLGRLGRLGCRPASRREGLARAAFTFRIKSRTGGPSAGCRPATRAHTHTHWRNFRSFHYRPSQLAAAASPPPPPPPPPSTRVTGGGIDSSSSSSSSSSSRGGHSLRRPSSPLSPLDSVDRRRAGHPPSRRRRRRAGRSRRPPRESSNPHADPLTRFFHPTFSISWHWHSTFFFSCRFVSFLFSSVARFRRHTARRDRVFFHFASSVAYRPSKC